MNSHGDVEAPVGLDRLRELALLQLEAGLLEGLVHLPLPEGVQLSSARGREVVV